MSSHFLISYIYPDSSHFGYTFLTKRNPLNHFTKHENVEIPEIMGIFSALTRASGREFPFTSVFMILANRDGFPTIEVNGRQLGWCVVPPIVGPLFQFVIIETQIDRVPMVT